MVRADAVRNRARVLAAARDEFAARGLAVPIDDIARAAGVGAGTVYRHFPTKESLYQAILSQHMEALVAEADALSGSDRPGEAFFELLASFATRGTGNRALSEALASGGVDVASALEGAIGSLQSAVGRLLERAQAAGAVRTDIGVGDLFALLGGVHAASDRGGDAAMTERLIAVVSDGLKASPDRS